MTRRERRRAREARREQLLANDAAERLRSRTVLHLGRSRVGGCPSRATSRANREALLDAVAGVRRTVPWGGGAGGGISKGSPLDLAKSFMDVVLQESKLLDVVRVVSEDPGPPTPTQVYGTPRWAGSTQTRPPWDTGRAPHRDRTTRGLLSRLRGGR